MMVYDDAHRAAALQDDPRWLRWRPAQPGGWAERSAGRFASDERSETTGPSCGTTTSFPARRIGRRSGPSVPLAGTAPSHADHGFQLVQHRRAARRRTSARRAARPWFQPHWVGDLTLSLRLKVQEAARRRSAGADRSRACRIDARSTWRPARRLLFHGGTALGEPAQTEITASGHLRAHVRQRRRPPDALGRRQAAVRRRADLRVEPTSRPPATAADLEPARIGARRAAIEVDRLVLKRDVYYTLEPAECDYANFDGTAQTDSTAFFELLSDPTRFSELAHHPPRDYVLGPGRYLMLGDNSPWSRDARAWGQPTDSTPTIRTRAGTHPADRAGRFPNRC